MKNLVPMVDPNDIVFGGWDISGVNLAEAMERAQVREQNFGYFLYFFAGVGMGSAKTINPFHEGY